MSTLETLMIVFIIVTTAAVVIQMGVLVALYIGVKRSSARMEALAVEVHARALPTLDMAHKLVQESRPKVDAILTNLAATSMMIREELERIDVSITDVVDRARLQVIRVDELVSRTLDRGFGASRIKVGDVAHMVDVNTKQSMSFHVAQEISSQHHTVADLALDADVHLY